MVAAGYQSVDAGDQAGHVGGGIVGVLLVGNEAAELDVSPELCLLRLLADAGVCGGDVGHCAGDVECGGEICEEAVVEADDFGCGAPVGVFVHLVAAGAEAGTGILCGDAACDEGGVGVAEAVDALLGVADDEVVVAAAHALVDQRPHVLPLQA